jgi:hypothetical protein
MSRLGLTIRAVSAVLLTGIASGFVVVASSSAYFLVSNSSSGSASSLLDMTSFLWFAASLVGIASAAVLGLVIEWPKVLWLARQNSPSRTSSILVSVLAAEALILVPTIIGLWRQAVRPPDMGETLLFNGLVASLGGICSAVLWWKLVLVPLRRGRQC